MAGRHGGTQRHKEVPPVVTKEPEWGRGAEDRHSTQPSDGLAQAASEPGLPSGGVGRAPRGALLAEAVVAQQVNASVPVALAAAVPAHAASARTWAPWVARPGQAWLLSALGVGVVLALMALVALAVELQRKRVDRLREQSRTVSVPAPAPAPRLSKCNTSFLVPVTGLLRCGKTVHTFDVPVSPEAWPLQVTLWRPDVEGAWAMFELTVDAIAAAGLPPLFSCRKHGGPEGAVTGVSLLVTDSRGAVVGFIRRRGSDAVLEREGFPDWEIEDRLGDASPVAALRVQGRVLGLATSIGFARRQPFWPREEQLQLDTQQEAKTPEAALALVCLLAVLIFRPSS